MDIRELVRVAEEAGYITEVVDGVVTIRGVDVLFKAKPDPVDGNKVELTLNYGDRITVSFARYVMFIQA
jgi:hypothetical protein